MHIVEGVEGYLGFIGCNTAGMESIPEKWGWFSWCVRGNGMEDLGEAVSNPLSL